MKQENIFHNFKSRDLVVFLTLNLYFTNIYVILKLIVQFTFFPVFLNI